MTRPKGDGLDGTAVSTASSTRAAEEVPPDPAATIESLRSLGYDPGSALADLIDNSLAAGATQVHVRARWEPTSAWCAVIDNGSGMSETRLREAMRVGSRDPLDTRPEGDLGRFGFGLKTASFSQAREVTVASRTKAGRRRAVRCWDVDEVRRAQRWMLLKEPPQGAHRILEDLDSGGHGTIVLWRRLGEMVDAPDGATHEQARRAFRRRLEAISGHLGMVFSRFLSDGDLMLKVNNHKIPAWDPFLADHPATQELPAEKLRFHDADVVLRPYVLPHESKLDPPARQAAGGPAGWTEQQGFYVYRQDRLITAGDWLGLNLARDDQHILARISVDVPNTLDDAWRLDITKGTVRPPEAMRSELTRIARLTRQRARAVLRHRGGVARRSPDPRLEHVWVQRSSHGTARLRVNRTHPLIADLIARSGELAGDIKDMLTLVEESVPLPLLPASAEPPAPLEDQTPEAVMRLAERAYDALLKQGKTRSEAAQRLRNTEPFHLYPAIVERLESGRGL